MLQYPTNFYPENVAIDATKKNHIEFTFNGDFLTSVTFRVSNYITGESGDSFTMGENNMPKWYNGDKVLIKGLSDLINGDDYTVEMLLTQTDNNGNLIYDMPVLSGTIYSIQANKQSSVFIANHITNIYEWDKAEGVKSPTIYNGIIVAGMVIQINSESRFIESYNVDTGEVILDSPFSFSVTNGMKYVIKSNYLISAQYFFKCRSTPTIIPTLSLYNNLFNYDFVAKAEYSQAESVMISYYRLYLYSSMGTNPELAHEDILISDTGKIYSQKIEYYFKRVIQTEHRNNTSADYYKLVCEVVTHDGMTSTGEYVLRIPFTDSKINVSDISTKCNKNEHTFCLKFRYDLSDLQDSESANANYVRVVRKNVDTGEILYIGTITEHSDTIRSIYDYALPCRGNYVYRITGLLSNGAICNESIEIPISPIMTGYSIANIIKDNAGRYFVGDIWRFTADIQNTTVTQNINRYLHVGYNQYPTTSSVDVNYMSGTLSGMIGYMNCATKEYIDDITLVKEWRKFITQPSLFMLKSQKGDVWFVNITDNPMTEYQEDYYKIPTTFSFNWVETEKDIVLEQNRYHI